MTEQCPDCDRMFHGHCCSCGYVNKKEEHVKPDFRCTWVTNNNRCTLSGNYTVQSKGIKNYYCYWHSDCHNSSLNYPDMATNKILFYDWYISHKNSGWLKAINLEVPEKILWEKVGGDSS